MKKFLFAVLLFSTISSQTFAKTEGNYIGFNVIRTKTLLDSIKLSTGTKMKVVDGNNYIDPNKNSAGINYKYAFNFHRFFIAPEAFFDYSNLETKDKDNGKYNIKYRYGAKINLGYDLTNKFATYFNFGAVNNKYKVDLTSYSGNYGTKSGNDLAWLYGGGIKYSLTNNIDLNIEYEASQVVMKSPPIGTMSSKLKFNVTTFKFGAAYKF